MEIQFEYYIWYQNIVYEWLSKLNSIFYLQLCKIISSPAVSNIESAFKLI